MSTFQLTLATEEGGITTTTVKLTDRVTTLSTTIENAFRIPASQQELYHDGNLVPATHTFFSAGIIDGDLLLIKQNVLTVPPITPTTSPTPTPLDHILQNPAFMSQLKVQNPLLWQRVLLRCPNVLNDVVQWIQQSAPTSLLPQDSAPAPALPTAPSRTIDPMSVEGQRAIEERIRHENVMENMEAALEHNPEAFGRVVMLFVDCKINTMSGIKAFVDSGAQATIISKMCARRCGILHLLDNRYKGIARGVGTAKIFGRIHLAMMTLGSEVFEITFTVMESIGGGYDILLGLDMLRKHAAVIDLANNCLRIGAASVPFLGEKDIPAEMREEPDAQ